MLLKVLQVLKDTESAIKSKLIELLKINRTIDFYIHDNISFSV